MSIGNVDFIARQFKSSQIKIRHKGKHDTEWEIRKNEIRSDEKKDRKKDRER